MLKIALVVLSLTVFSAGNALAFEVHAPTHVGRGLRDMPQLLRHAHYKFLPLPVIATDPAEGETYGVLPVVVATDENDEIVSVFATALTYNSVMRVGGFGIWLMTPTPDEELRLFGGASQRFYREASLDYANRRWIEGKFRFDLHFWYLEDPFERFFGFGPKTPKSAESNFTSLLFRGWGEAAYEIARNFSAVAQADWSRVGLQPKAISSVADTAATYGAHPEVAGSNQMVYRLGFRWDSRDDEFFPTKGVYASALGIFSRELAGDRTFFGGYELRFKFAWQPTPRFTSVGSWRWQQLFGDRVPFYLQSSLGGEKELRGFVARRFTDRHATVLDLEERVLIKEWTLLGTKVALSIDPFFSVGQVFRRIGELKPANFEPAGGVGFRMRASPSVLGRVDVSYSRDGVAVYTTLDYPF